MMRRLFLVLASAIGLGAAASVYDLRELGAAGDGKTADDAAFALAVRKLTAYGGGELYVPPGSYRFQSFGRDALRFEGVGNLYIRFAPGAEILMDNLHPEVRNGGGHGIVIVGPCRNITLENVRVRWAETPSSRSHGDAFRFEGYPDDAQAIHDVTMSNCYAEKSPQTGAVFMGVSDVAVNNFRVVDSLADGLHFNACRRVDVNTYCGINNGDDALAFVTYYATEFFGARGSPFGFPYIGEWSNSDCNVVNVHADGGHADGIRISGSKNINVANVSIKNKWGGIQLDSAVTSENGAVGWSYFLSQNVNLSNIIVENCQLALIIRSLNVLPDAPGEFWSSDISVDNITIRNASELAVDLQGVAGVAISNLRSDSPVRLLNNRGAWLLSNWRLADCKLEIHGVQRPEPHGYKTNYEPLPLVYDAGSEILTGSILINGLRMTGGELRVCGINGIEAHAVALSGNTRCNFQFTDLQLP